MIPGDVTLYGTLWTASDERIKFDIRRITPQHALDTIRRLKPSTFVHRDRVARTRGRVAGFIAQEVEQVEPSLVYSDRTEFVPNICECVKLHGPSELVVSAGAMAAVSKGSKVMLYVRSSTTTTTTPVEQHLEIIQLRPDSSTGGGTVTVSEPVRFADDPSVDVFLYGTQVTDFRTLEYDGVSTMTVGAVQALATESQALQSQVACLSNDLKALATENSGLKARLAVIEAMLLR
ncbi:hypothetical protein OEZ85_011007 [Tetradesmus obliquus]|uniref:Peptidase S74 domain-containing protein n=1 Tax=Tetradesmus obliquus TaxID=3088 RepID=A0ABY8TNZ8_TETOB|nr:hypothetical protein OEZ85_011007 [Tetradesmus obliquus]